MYTVYRGKITLKVEPTPCWEVTSIRPPSFVTKALEIANPNPTPLVHSVNLTKRSKTRSNWSSGIPSPVSVT